MINDKMISEAEETDSDGIVSKLSYMIFRPCRV